MPDRVIIVHGTFSNSLSFQKSLSKLTWSLAIEVPHAEIAWFSWSGQNTFSARESASADLARLLSRSLERDDLRVIIIAHSHGGNVALKTMRELLPDLRSRVRLVCIATPFLGLWNRQGIQRTSFLPHPSSVHTNDYPLFVLTSSADEALLTLKKIINFEVLGLKLSIFTRNLAIFFWRPFQNKWMRWRVASNALLGFILLPPLLYGLINILSVSSFVIISLLLFGFLLRLLVSQTKLLGFWGGSPTGNYSTDIEVSDVPFLKDGTRIHKINKSHTIKVAYYKIPKGFGTLAHSDLYKSEEAISDIVHWIKRNSFGAS